MGLGLGGVCLCFGGGGGWWWLLLLLWVWGGFLQVKTSGDSSVDVSGGLYVPLMLLHFLKGLRVDFGLPDLKTEC